MTPEKTLETLSTDKTVDMDRFAAGFLAEIPAAQVMQIISDMK
jgi:hypothetical protein